MVTNTEYVIQQVKDEREAQKAHEVAKYDATNTLNDYVSYITAYAGRAATKCPRNEREVRGTPRAMLVKAAALAVAAIEYIDSGTPNG